MSGSARIYGYIQDAMQSTSQSPMPRDRWLELLPLADDNIDIEDLTNEISRLRTELTLTRQWMEFFHEGWAYYKVKGMMEKIGKDAL